MTSEQIRLVKRSFAYVQPFAARTAHLFYGRLFAIAPEVRPLFVGDLAAQGDKLMRTIAVVVTDLDRIDRVLPVATDLARRHVGYGAKIHHYAAVGAALIWALREGLGARFTPPVETAWTAAYTLLADAMIAAARDHTA